MRSQNDSSKSLPRLQEKSKRSIVITRRIAREGKKIHHKCQKELQETKEKKQKDHKKAEKFTIIDRRKTNYESDNVGNKTFLEALQSLRLEVFEKLIETDNNQLLQNKQELSFDEDTKFLSNEYKELLSNENDEFSSNENNEFSSDTDTVLLSKENNKLSFDANTELSSEEDNECLFYINDDK
ncbi:10606_t:CDS:2, partial [Cetraspora pellucida]